VITRAAIACLALSVIGANEASAQAYETAAAARAVAFERLVSAVRIETRQESYGAQQVTTAEAASYKAMATSFGEVDRALQVREAMRTYESMQTAVGGACADVEANKLAGRAGQNNSDIMAAITEQERNWVQDGGSRVSIMAGTQSARESFLCSADEAAAGLCEQGAHLNFGAIAAGDTDASPFLLRSNGGARSYGNIEAQVGMIYMDTLLPLPSIPPAGEATGMTDRLSRAEAMRQMAIISLGRASVGGIIVRGLEGGVE